MISSLSVNHWRKQCFRLVRAQQAEPNIEKAVSNGGFFYARKKSIDNVPTNNKLSNSQYSSLKTATVASVNNNCCF